ncbi:MAG: gamma-glutamylcyclotransferase [Chitinophagales bacterium]|nr:gamma-glutamylcyclotransferase [Chitinophagales bacterium]HMV13933.1 gamma-glutamylcyclotransferase [Chitinophagales bacterium]HMW12292.1 gamma-glutamylcyclotransferase [Chitinophagales bacterium]HMX58969.1 gamma-glutamylcyclotransferase [Chitinophagales bacterium]HMY22651.1 gamma-glutamylcyclotransferase [Chitinophagales bacterium]
MPEYLFTYGTLRLNQSHPIATYLAENASLYGLAILPKAKLYKIDWYPALIETTNEADEVVGDVFVLNNDTAWSKIDEYEGIGIGEPPYEYRRTKVKIKTDAGELECWVYFYNLPLPADASCIESGDFLNP